MECGSQDLTVGVPCLNLRPLVLVLLGFIIWKLVPVLLASLNLGERLNHLYWFFLNEVLSRAILYALVALIISWFLGPRAFAAVQNFWVGALRLFLDAVIAVGRWVLDMVVKFLLRGPTGGEK